MIAGALFYCQFLSIKNRLLTRVKRLRKPKYLFGAIVWGLYFYFCLIRAFLLGRRGPISAAHHEIAVSLAAVALMVIILFAWIIPNSRVALAFTEAEVAFLFPAPITRRALIHFKLLKSQFAILFSSLLMAVIGRTYGGNFIISALGWWALLSMFNLHLLGSSFALTMLMDQGISNRTRRACFLGIVVLVIGGVYFWMRAALPPLPQRVGASDLSGIFDYAGRVLQSGPLPYLLFPFRLMVAPYFAPDPGKFLLAIGPALAIIGLHYWWVTTSNVTFEEASIERSRKDADRIASGRSGNWRGMQKPKKAAHTPFALSPVGNPAVAVFWKNLISVGHNVSARVFLIVLWAAIASAGVLRSQGGTDVRFVIFVLAAMLSGMSLISGPQMLRNDLRQDLPMADLLKTYPMAGWRIVLGELLAPAAILAAGQWILLTIAFVTFPPQLVAKSHIVPFQLRLGIALGAAVVLPFVDLIAMLIPNASALL
ncbi:MAG TPA: putative ABC exporter domain-containing protein, partial [Verrucomicrobiae bacterium]|nr:putative ABC exporter domain-containing protein [Verrucomicrobiae bacterium]